MAMVAQCVPPAGEALRDDPHGGGSTQKPQAEHEKKACCEDTSCGRKEPHDTDTPPDWGSSSDDVVPLHNWPCGDSGRPSDRGDSPGHLAQRPSEQKGAAAPRTTTRLTYYRRGACPLGSQPAVARSTTSTRACGKKPRRTRSLEKLTGGARSTRGTFCPPCKFWSVDALGTDRLPRKRPTQQLLRGTRCELFKGLLAFFVQPMNWATSPEILVCLLNSPIHPRGIRGTAGASIRFSFNQWQSKACSMKRGETACFWPGTPSCSLSSPADAWAPALVCHVLHILLPTSKLCFTTSVGEAPSYLSSRAFFGNIEAGELDTRWTAGARSRAGHSGDRPVSFSQSSERERYTTCPCKPPCIQALNV